MVDGFATAANSRNILLQVIALAIVAAGQTVVIISGGIDLSIPWMTSVAAILLTYLTHGQDQALIWALPTIFAVAIGVGPFNGFGVAVLKVHPIIMTLASNVILSGAIVLIAGTLPPATPPPAIRWLGQGQVAGVPVAFLLLAAVGSRHDGTAHLHQLRPAGLRRRRQPDGQHLLGSEFGPRADRRLCRLRLQRGARRHFPGRLCRHRLAGYRRQIPVRLGRVGGGRRRLYPRRQRQLSRNARRSAAADADQHPADDLLMSAGTISIFYGLTILLSVWIGSWEKGGLARRFSAFNR